MNVLYYLKQFKGNTVLKNGTLFSLYSFIGQGVSFFLLILLAKYIQPEEYGHLSLYNTSVMLIGFLMGLSSSGYVSISYFKKTDQEFKKDFTAIFTLYLLSEIFFIIILTFFGEIIAKLLHLTVQLLWMAIIISLFNAFFSINLNLFRIKEKVVSYGILSCGNALLNFALSLILVISFKQSWMGRVHAQFICSILLGLIAIVVFLKYKLFSFNFEWNRYKTIILWSLPLIPHLATMWLRQGCDRYIIDNSHSVYDVGVFSFAVNLVTIFAMVGNAFNSSASVSLYKILSSEEETIIKKGKLNKHTRMMFYLYTATCVILLLVLPTIVHFFLPKYSPSLGYFYVLSLYGYLECLYFLYINYMFYYGKTKELMYITFGTAILHLALSLCFTRYSLYCTAAIYVIVDIALISILYIIVRRIKIENSLT